jgi:transposase
MTPTPQSRKNAASRRKQVKAFILRYWREHCAPPTQREIADEFGTSTSVVNIWLKKFEQEGWLTPRRYGLARSIVPVNVAQLLSTLKAG